MNRPASAVPRRIHWFLTRFPATIAIMSLILLIAYLTAGTSLTSYRLLIDDIGLDLSKVLNWQLWTLPASTVIQSNPGIGPKLAILIVIGLASIEYIAGSARAVITFFLADWISAPLTILAAWPLAHLGLHRAYVVLYRPDTGSSAAALGAVAAAMMFLPGRWRVAFLGTLFAILVYLLPTPGLSANIAHLLGAFTGAVIGLVWIKRLPDRRWSIGWIGGSANKLWDRVSWQRSAPPTAREHAAAHHHSDD